MNPFEITNAIVAIVQWMRRTAAATEGTPKGGWRIVDGCSCEGCIHAREQARGQS